MKTLRIISTILLALLPIMYTSAEQRLSFARTSNLQTGKIIGVVLDANNARIVGAAIKIKNAQFYREAQSGAEGEFAFELPAGVYQITVEQPGFRRFKLSSFRVQAHVRELVNIHMEVKEPRGLQKVE